MDLTDFTAMVKDEANKGDRLDASYAARIAMAVQRAERKYSLKYMERFTTLTFLNGTKKTAFPTDASTTTLKSINFLRFSYCGEYNYITQVDPADVVRDSGTASNISLRYNYPEGYWLDGVSYIYIDNTVSADLACDFNYNMYSAWPPAGGVHWLLSNAADWLLGETMKLLATVAKEPKWREDYRQMQTEAEGDLFRADNEQRHNDRNYTMQAPGTQVVRTRRYPGDDGV